MGFRLKREKARLISHAQAFLMYYKIKEKLTIQTIKKLKRKPSRIRLIFEKFEHRLDILLIRLQWVPDLRTARAFISHGCVVVSKSIKGNCSIITDSSYCLIPGDCLHILKCGRPYVFYKIKIKNKGYH
jgi:ribosomal protein S4